MPRYFTNGSEELSTVKKSTRVKKNWGEEIWIINNSCLPYGAKILRLENNKYSSYHYHFIKTETFYVLKGKVRIICEYGVEFILRAGESLNIKRTKHHQFRREGNSLAEILEVSDSHHIGLDTYRISKHWMGS